MTAWARARFAGAAENGVAEAMKKEKTFKSWKEFEAEVVSVAEKQQHLRPLFRGQRKENWNLDTTLERYLKLHGVTDVDYSVRLYHQKIISASGVIETVTEKKWELPENYQEDDGYSKAPKGYEFMVFLRQNGFPSPLLDWSSSPYIAAFFALRHADPKESEFAAVFEYVESTGSGKDICPGEATICPCGPWIATDKKHFLQQSQYTICRKQKDGINFYASHEEVFARGEEEQDVLTKYLIPVSERERVLRKLRLMNITSYSLFENTESLLELVAQDLQLI
jgi:hypothetical protein